MPGAAHLDPEADLTGEIGDASRGRHPLPETEPLAEAFGRAGIDADTFVLALDDGSGRAARCWWLLRHLGHDRCGTLDLRSYAGRFERGESPTTARAFVPHVRTDDVIELDLSARAPGDAKPFSLPAHFPPLALTLARGTILFPGSTRLALESGRLSLGPGGEGDALALSSRIELGGPAGSLVADLELAAQRRGELIEIDTLRLGELGSLNGTYVNRQRVVQRLLGDNDEIMLGSRCRIVFRDDTPEMLEKRKRESSLKIEVKKIAADMENMTAQLTMIGTRSSSGGKAPAAAPSRFAGM